MGGECENKRRGRRGYTDPRACRERRRRAVKGTGADAIPTKGPHRDGERKMKGADAEAMQTKGPPREEKEKIKGAGA